MFEMIGTMERGAPAGRRMAGAAVQGGFTLVELMVVLAVMGIIAAIAAPSFTGLSQRASVKAATRDVVSAFQKARIEAIRQGATWRVRFDAAGRNMQVLSPGEDRVWGTGDDSVFSTVEFLDRGVVANSKRYGNVSFGAAAAAGMIPDIPGTHVPMQADAIQMEFRRDGTVGPLGTIYLQSDRGDCFAVQMATGAGNIVTWKHTGGAWKD